MVDRPLADRRPIGPLVNLENVGEEGKSVFGVTGTPMPGREKNPLVITFILEGKHQAFLPQDLSSRKSSGMGGTAGQLGDRIKDKIDLEGGFGRNIKAIKSGRGSEIPMGNQAIAVTVPGEALPVQEGELNRVANTIDSFYDGETTVKTFIIDQE